MAVETNLPKRLVGGIAAAALVAAGAVMTSAVSSAHSPAKWLPTLRLPYYAYGTRGWYLDPAYLTNQYEEETMQLVQANLVRLVPSGKPVPDLAAWSISKNHLVYTFTLRKNAPDTSSASRIRGMAGLTGWLSRQRVDAPRTETVERSRWLLKVSRRNWRTAPRR
jgi:hypothetical protein